MSHIAELPLWAAVLVALFLLLGASLTLIGTIGLYRLRSFYERNHAPTLGASWGTAAIVMASMLYFSVSQSRPVMHELLIGTFVLITAPVSFMLLTRAALYRDRAKGSREVPPVDLPEGVLHKHNANSNNDSSHSSEVKSQDG